MLALIALATFLLLTRAFRRWCWPQKRAYQSPFGVRRLRDDGAYLAPDTDVKVLATGGWERGSCSTPCWSGPYWCLPT
jgi:hypothetical protein